MLPPGDLLERLLLRLAVVQDVLAVGVAGVVSLAQRRLLVAALGPDANAPATRPGERLL